MEIVTSWEEKGIAKGLAMGREEGREHGLEQGLERGRLAEAELLLRQLHRRVGAISPDRRERVLCLSFERLEGLGDALLEFSSLSELDAWLDAPPAEPTTGG